MPLVWDEVTSAGGGVRLLCFLRLLLSLCWLGRCERVEGLDN
jgi:hypothetical protein